jgi:hypothetical protein
VIHPRRLLPVAGVAVLVAALAGCAGTVSLEPAANADDPACADVSVTLPGSIAGQERRWTDAQATAAWGSPATVILTCGLESPGPTTMPCRDLDGIDWIVDESQAADDRYTFTTFGREPAVQVFLDYAEVSSSDALGALAPAVSKLPKTGAECTERPSASETPAG